MFTEGILIEDVKLNPELIFPLIGKLC